MTSLLSSSNVLAACYLLHDSRPLGPTLRPSTPVCRCHRDSWTRGRLALAQDAVRCTPSLSVSLLILLLLIYARSCHETFDEFLLLGSRPVLSRSVYHVGKMSPEEILTEHVVDIHRIEADFRDAFESSSSQSYGVNKYFSFQSTKAEEAQHLQLEPWARRGKEDAFEKEIAGKWHIITLQEASQKVEHEILRERFHVTHFAGCAILFNKDTFYPDISVKSFYLHDTRRGLQDQVVEGEQGWVLQGFLSRASIRRAAASGQKVFTVLSLHINNVFAKKRVLPRKIIQTVRALLISQDIDLVARRFQWAPHGVVAAETISVLLISVF